MPIKPKPSAPAVPAALVLSLNTELTLLAVVQLVERLEAEGAITGAKLVIGRQTLVLNSAAEPRPTRPR